MVRPLLAIGTALLFLALASLAACVGDKSVSATSGDAGSSAPIAGVGNIKDNADFENVCAGWGGDRAKLAPTTVAHTGKSACLVCAETEGGVWSVSGRVPKDKLVGGTSYVATAWLRKPEAPAMPADDLKITLLIDRGDNPSTGGDQDIVPGDEIDTPALSDQFQQASSAKVKYEATDDLRSMLTSIIQRTSEPVSCFIVDDWVITPTAP